MSATESLLVNRYGAGKVWPSVRFGFVVLVAPGVRVYVSSCGRNVTGPARATLGVRDLLGLDAFA